MEHIDPIDLVVSDFDRSLAFDAELLRPLGFRDTSEITGQRGEPVAFTAQTRAMVDERGRGGARNGHEIESGPAERDDYAVFFYDPDGLKLELVHRSV